MNKIFYNPPTAREYWKQAWHTVRAQRRVRIPCHSHIPAHLRGKSVVAGAQSSPYLKTAEAVFSKRKYLAGLAKLQNLG